MTELGLLNMPVDKWWLDGELKFIKDQIVSYPHHYYAFNQLDWLLSHLNLSGEPTHRITVNNFLDDLWDKCRNEGCIAHHYYRLSKKTRPELDFNKVAADRIHQDLSSASGWELRRIVGQNN